LARNFSTGDRANACRSGRLAVRVGIIAHVLADGDLLEEPRPNPAAPFAVVGHNQAHAAVKAGATEQGHDGFRRQISVRDKHVAVTHQSQVFGDGNDRVVLKTQFHLHHALRVVVTQSKGASNMPPNIPKFVCLPLHSKGSVGLAAGRGQAGNARAKLQ